MTRKWLALEQQYLRDECMWVKPCSTLRTHDPPFIHWLNLTEDIPWRSESRSMANLIGNRFAIPAGANQWKRRGKQDIGAV